MKHAVVGGGDIGLVVAIVLAGDGFAACEFAFAFAELCVAAV